MPQPAVSILAITYNHEPFVRQCLDSILAQSFAGWELLILDDGSKDATWEVIQQYARQDERVRAFRQENLGIAHLAENLNFLLNKAEGDLIATISGDDYWPLDKLHTQVPIHCDHEVVFSYGRAALFNQQGVAGEYGRPPKGGALSTRDVLRWLLVRQAHILPVSILIRKSALLEIGGFHQDAGTPVEDYPTYLRLLTLPGSVYWIDHLLGYYRLSDTQVTKKYAAGVAEAALATALGYVRALSPQARKDLGVTEAGLTHAHYVQVLLPSYLADMRCALLANDRSAAVRFAYKLIKHGTLKRRIQGLCGLFASRFGWHLEPLFSLYGRWGRRQENA